METMGTRVAPVRLAIAFALAACRILAHDIPNDVTVQALFKPEGQRLRMIVRVPMKAMRDVDFPTRGDYMDLERSLPLARDAAKIWVADSIDVYEADSQLPRFQVVAAQISLESDRSFADFDQALAHITGPPLDPATTVVWSQTMLDVLLETPIRSERSEFAIHSGLARLGLHVVTALRFLPPGGAVRAFEFTDDPGLLRLDPRWHQAAGRFVVEGFWHILDGSDHLLFLLCLVIPFRKFRALVPIVTAFTAAHSITLIASAYGIVPDVLWFAPLVETLIAASIVYMAVENIAGQSTLHRRWMVAFLFGLVHGFGFSFALRETLQFAGSHLLTSLVSFNIGIEIGQLLVLAIFIPALDLLFRYALAERMGTIIVSAFVAHTGWHWMADRYDKLRQFRFEWPGWNLVILAALMRWLAIGLAAAALVWLGSVLIRRYRSNPRV